MNRLPLVAVATLFSLHQRRLRRGKAEPVPSTAAGPLRARGRASSAPSSPLQRPWANDLKSRPREQVVSFAARCGSFRLLDPFEFVHRFSSVIEQNGRSSFPRRNISNACCWVRGNSFPSLFDRIARLTAASIRESWQRGHRHGQIELGVQCRSLRLRIARYVAFREVDRTPYPIPDSRFPIPGLIGYTRKQ